MAGKPIELTIRGKLHYAKILGNPVLNFGKDGNEWKMDLELTSPASVKELRAAGLEASRIKQKDGYLDGEPYISLKQAETQKKIDPETGKPKLNKPPKVVNRDGKPWPQEDLIGNGTDADVKIAVVDNGPGMQHSAYIRAVRVLRHVPYASTDFTPLDEDDEFFAAGDDAAEPEPEVKEQKKASSRSKQTTAEDLDDDIPF